MRSAGWLFGGLLTLGGCSLALDLETKQCHTKKDCDALLGAEKGDTYLCTQGVCQREVCDGKTKDDGFCRDLSDQFGTPFKTAVCDGDPASKGEMRCVPGCLSSRDCQEGDVCEVVLNRCLEPAKALCPAGKDEECSRFDGLAACVDGVCKTEECTTDKDCQRQSSTASCRQGRCFDPAWGCVDDERSDELSGTAAYELIALEAISTRIPADLSVQICGDETDTECMSPPAGAKAEIDVANDKVVITGLPRSKDTRIHLILSGSTIFTTELISQQPITSERVVASAPIYFIPNNRGLIEATLSYSDTGELVDVINNATVIARIFDCEHMLAAGISASSSRNHTANGTVDTRLFFLGDGNIVRNEALVTDSYGTLGFANLVGGATTELAFTIGVKSEEITSIRIKPRAGWMTYVHVYPD